MRRKNKPSHFRPSERHPSKRGKLNNVPRTTRERLIYLLALFFLGTIGIYWAQRFFFRTELSPSIPESTSSVVIPPMQPDLAGTEAIAFTDFVGAEACRTCHAEQYNVWEKSTHGNAGGEPGQAKLIAKFNGEALHFKDAVVVPTTNKNNELIFQITPNGQATQEIKVAAIIGGGHLWGGGTQSFFARFPDGTLKFLPFDYIRDEKTWFVQLREQNEWAPINRTISLTDLANWPPSRILGVEPQHSNCQNCHGSQIFVQYDANTKRYDTRYQALHINCESCHGPGRRHLDLMQQNDADRLTDIGMKPLATLTKDQSLEICFQCHATKDVIQSQYLPGKHITNYFALKFPILGSAPYLPDGRVRFFAYQENHLYSACYLEGSMTCVDCHDPHAQNYREVTGQALADRFDNKQCTGCHASKIGKAEQHSHHRSASPGNRCVSCHMPYLQHRLVGNRLKFARADHSIPIPRPLFDAAWGIESACQKCHPQLTTTQLQGHLDKWYGKIKPHHPQVENLLKAASVNDLKTAAALLLNKTPVHAMAQVANLSQFIKNYLHPDMTDLPAEIIGRLQSLAESDDLEVKALALVALHYGAGFNSHQHDFFVAALRNAGAAENALRRRWAMAMDYLGVWAANERGNFNQAITAHRKALEIAPNDYAIWINLSLAYQGQGDFNQALITLQRALALAPTEAAVYFQLAQVYYAVQQIPAAITAVKNGLQYDPTNEKAQQFLQYLQSPRQ